VGHRGGADSYIIADATIVDLGVELSEVVLDGALSRFQFRPYPNGD